MATSTLPPPRLYNPLQDKHHLPTLAQIHADCITHDNQLATFLPPLNHDKMLNYWLDLSSEVERDVTAIVLQFAPAKPGEGEGEVAGYVCLMMPPSETGPFRGLVNKLMVSPRFRRMGIARRVMGLLEEVARERRRELLILDTTIGSDADQVYPRLGYKDFGVLPKYGISPKDGSLVDERFYYKDLRDV